MNDLQKCELDLLKEFIKICNELQLHYYLVCGSALGAVKYGGFIPWDDDIDVALLRDDYEIFLKEAPSRLAASLFLQTNHSDRLCPITYAKLRDSATTYIEKTDRLLNIHHGVYIDIFPLDGYPQKRTDAVIFEIKKAVLKKMLVAVYQQPSVIKQAMAIPLRLIGIQKWYPYITEALNRLYQRYPCQSSALLCNHSNWQGRLEYAPKEQYGKGTAAKFEGISVVIPEQYDAYLTQKYGNWREDLPQEEQKGHHSYTVCDLEKPYTDYI